MRRIPSASTYVGGSHSFEGGSFEGGALEGMAVVARLAEDFGRGAPIVGGVSRGASTGASSITLVPPPVGSGTTTRAGSGATDGGAAAAADSTADREGSAVIAIGAGLSNRAGVDTELGAWAAGATPGPRCHTSAATTTTTIAMAAYTTTRDAPLAGERRAIHTVGSPAGMGGDRFGSEDALGGARSGSTTGRSR